MKSEMEQIEISIEQAKEKIAKTEALGRLMESQDWKDVIEDGYFVQEASNVVLLKATPGFAEEDKQKQLNRQIIAIGAFRQYLSSIFQIGGMAQKSIEEYEQMKTEILDGE